MNSPPSDFSPPTESGGRFRAGVTLATLIHGLLILALAWGVNWNSSPPEGVEAELWSAVPQIAAPRAAEPEPQPPQPRPAPKTPPLREPTPPKPNEQELRNAQIALEKAKRAEKDRIEKKKDEERLRRDKEERERERQKELDKEREKKQAEAEKRKLKDQQDKTEAARQQALKRMLGQAEGSGDPSSSGNASRTSGPSAGYAGRIKARIKPKIVFTETIPGNPVASVEVRLAPDGHILSQRIVTSSGHKEWDEAVLRAVERTEILPRDTDGTIPPVMLINFKPQD